VNLNKRLSRFLIAGALAFAIVLCFSSTIRAQPSYTWDWSNSVNFGLSSLGTKICFDNNILLGSFTFMDGTQITYNSILLDSHVNTITLGTQTANMTVTYLASTRLDYNVTGAGTQIVNIGLEPDSVYVDGIYLIEGMGYSYNDETDMVTITGASETAIITFLSGSSPGGGIVTGFTSPLFQYLLEGDFIGFILACYTTTIGSVFYAISIFFVSAVIYIRQRSLFIVSIIWLFVGGAFIGLFWEFSAVAVWFTLLGIAGLFAEFITVWRRGH